jgi:hypothetical protein
MIVSHPPLAARQPDASTMRRVAGRDHGSGVAVAGGFDGDVAVYRITDGRRTPPSEGCPGLSAPTTGCATTRRSPSGRTDASTSVRSPAPSASSTPRRFTSSAPSPLHRSAGRTRSRLRRTAPSSRADQTRSSRSTCPPLSPLEGRPQRHPSRPVPWLAVAPTLDRLYCRNESGVIEERYLESGARTDVDRSPARDHRRPLGHCRRRELVAFGGEAGAVSRWRLDGSGPVTNLIAEGHLVGDAATAHLDGRCSSRADLRLPRSTPTSPTSRSGTRSATATLGDSRTRQASAGSAAAP